MIPPEHRPNDRTSYYTMKTTQGIMSAAATAAAGSPGLSHSRSASQSYISGKTTPSSPIPSPQGPPSAGQPRPPKLSPGAARGLVQDVRTASPNYFGLAVDPITDPRDSAMLPRENWSSPSSSVKSFAAAIPKQLPLDANPEFEAFRRQIDANRARAAFSLSASHFNIPSSGLHTPPPVPTSAALQRPRPPRWHTQGADGSEFPWPRPSIPATGSCTMGGLAGGKADHDADSLQEDSAYVSADSKRSSAVSLNPPVLPNISRQDIPALLKKSQVPLSGLELGGFNLAIPKKGSRLGTSPQVPQALVGGKAVPLSPTAISSTGATAPAAQLSGDDGPKMMPPAELKDLLEKDQGSTVLLLDLRVSPQFAQARIRGALNLCIPTTLLKRATFNLQKLQQTFQADEDQEKFSNWRNASHLVVYDASSSDKRDAVSSLNMIKKFTNEGYTGSASILCGGFNAFAAAYPNLIDSSSSRPSPGLSLGAASATGGLRTNVPPVIGGVLLPNASHLPSPFFSNIRQNQDLVDGVGQMEVGVPSGLAPDSLPRWLREAAEAGDHGKRVSDKFLRIELLEQSRMREAYSLVKSEEPAGDKSAQEDVARVQLSGIEKGGKNRYKDILPFEHARVRLLGRPPDGCDYVNASHLRAKRSYKRYIASQGPLPATFEDFWSVVWDNDVRVIVMLTAESEGGQLKCHPYWKGKDFGSIKLRVLSEKKVSLDIDKHQSPPSTAQPSSSDVGSSEGARRRANTTSAFDWGAQSQPSAQPNDNGSQPTPHVIIRKFALSHAAHPFSPIREITQLHYPSWPDFGAPAQPSHLLALVELANLMQRATAPVNSNAAPGSASPPQQHGVDFNTTVDTSARHNIDRESPTRSRRLESEASALSWPDGPESSEHPQPMLVHCSAGCGRTGAFCTVDSVIDMLKRQRRHMLEKPANGTNGQTQSRPLDSEGDTPMDEAPNGARGPVTAQQAHTSNNSSEDLPDIDTSWLGDDSVDLIARTVEDFRGQRLSMVQSLRQFVLCYETVLEWLLRLQQAGSGGHDARGRARSGSFAF